MTEDFAKQRSLMFLSLLCFALADVRDGLGPFLGIYFQQQGWNPDEIGFVMTIGALAALFWNTPLGALADHTRFKRGFMALSIVLIVAGCGVVFCCGGILAAGISKIIQSIAASAIMPALSGITLGMVGQKGLPIRLGINEAWSHGGNAATAALSGFVGYFFGIIGVFFVMTAMGFLALFSLFGIKASCIDYNTARGLEPSASAIRGRHLRGMRILFGDKALLAVALTLFFFHLGNAALLPLLGQSAVARFQVNGAAYTAGTIILAQVTMIAAALWGAHTAQKKGYGWLFLIALLALPLRGFIAGLWASSWNIFPVQILDGVGAGLLGVATPGIVARILQGSGHINMGLGLVLTIQEVGASFSNTYGGLFAHYASYSAAFLALAAAPCAGLFIFLAAIRAFPAFANALKAEQTG